jgi:hypothetical protein
MTITQTANEPETKTTPEIDPDFAHTFASWFDPEEITQLARETEWMKRQRKILPFEFVLGAAFGQLSALEMTLNAQAACYTEPVTRQGVDQRYNERTVEFFHKLFDRLLGKTLLQSPQPALAKELAARFEAVHLIDSTSFDCPASLAKIFPGAGGHASTANCKILLDYEYTRGLFHPLDVVPGKRSDPGFAPTIASLLKPRELGMFDKGFWRPESFADMDRKGAFFLTPWHRSNSLWISDPKSPDGPAVRLEVADHLRHNAQGVVEWPEVWIGNPQAGLKLKVRMVAFRLSEESANRRRQALRRDMQKKGRTPNAVSLELAGWLILVTNAPVQLLPTSAMSYLYRVRWQIELVFKQCKSVLRIDQTKAKTNEHRIQSEIWARLMAALVLFAWHAHLQAAAAVRTGREISFAKVARWLQQQGMSLAQALIRGGDALIEELQRCWRHLLKTTSKGRQLTRETVWEVLAKHWLAAT